MDDTYKSAKKGNFSISLNAAVGGTGEERKDADSDSDIFDGDTDFDYQNRGVIVSTGFIFYHKKLQLKADYTYLTTDWN